MPKRKSRKRRRTKAKKGKASRTVTTSGDRSVGVGGDVVDSVIYTGDIRVGGLDATTTEKIGEGANAALAAQQNSEKILTQQEELKALISDSLVTEQSTRVKQLEIKFSVVESLYKQGDLRTALRKAEHLRASASDIGAYSDLQQRLTNIVASTKLSLGDSEQALQEYEEELAKGTASRKVRLNAAMAYLMSGDPESALALSKSALVEKKSSDAAAIMIQAIAEEDGLKAVDSLVEREKWLTTDSLSAAALASVYAQGGRHDEAESLLRQHLPGTQDTFNDAQHIALFAEVLIEQSQLILAKTLPLPWQLPNDVKTKLQEALSLLDRALTYWQNREPTSERLRLYLDRAGVHQTLGQIDQALSDLEAARRLDDKNIQLLLTTAKVYISEAKPKKAADLLSSIPLEKRNPNVNALLASAYQLCGKLTLAAETLERALPLMEEVQRLTALEGLLDIYPQVGATESTERIKALLEAEGTTRAASLGSLAHYEYRYGDKLKAFTLFENAMSAPDNGGVTIMTPTYAACLAQEGRWGDAADLLVPIATPNGHPQLLTDQTIYLYNAGRLREARTFAQDVRTEQGAIPVITELEAKCCLVARDHAAALPLWTELSQLESLNPEEKAQYQLEAAMSQVALGRYDAARASLNAVDYKQISDGSMLMRAAQLRHGLGMDRVLHLAWEARRMRPNDLDLHASFVMLFVKRDRAGNFDADKVTVDTTITLEDARGQKTTVTLVDRKDLHEGELELGSEIADRLLGKGLGDEILWQRGFTGEQYRHIVQIRHKYVAAFQDTDPSGFPSDRPALEVVRGEPEELAQNLVDQLIERENAVTPIWEQVEQNKLLPLHGLANLLSSSLSHVRASMRGRPTGKLYAFDGGQVWKFNKRDPIGLPIQLMSTHDYERLTARAVERVVVDESGLLTLAELYLLPRLTERYTEVIVAQSLVNKFDNELMQGTDRINPDQVPPHLTTVWQVRTWLRENAHIAPVLARLDPPTELIQAYDDIFGPVATDALLIAQVENAPLYSDDLGWTVSARKEWGLQSTNTQHLLDDLLERGKVSYYDQASYKVRLLELKFDFVTFNPKHLFALFTTEGLSPTLKTLTDHLAGPTTSSESAIRVAYVFLNFLLFVSSRPYTERFTAVRWLLDAVSEGRDPIRVAAILARAFENVPKSERIQVYMFSRVLAWWLSQRIKRVNLNSEPTGTSDNKNE